MFSANMLNNCHISLIAYIIHFSKMSFQHLFKQFWYLVFLVQVIFNTQFACFQDVVSLCTTLDSHSQGFFVLALQDLNTTTQISRPIM